MKKIQAELEISPLPAAAAPQPINVRIGPTSFIYAKVKAGMSDGENAFQALRSVLDSRQGSS